MLYLHLFNGRKDPNDGPAEAFDDGPVFGPFALIHTTYASDIQMRCVNNMRALNLTISCGCVYYDGMFYGDWSVFAEPMLTQDNTPGKRVMFDDNKAILA